MELKAEAKLLLLGRQIKIVMTAIDPKERIPHVNNG